jgi:hypothetical protein
MADQIEMVSAGKLAQGDRIILDDGREAEVRGTEMGGSKDRHRINLRDRAPLIVLGYWRPIFRRSFKAKRERERDPDRGCFHCHVFDRDRAECRVLRVWVDGAATDPAPTDCPIRTEGRVEAPYSGGIVVIRKAGA